MRDQEIIGLQEAYMQVCQYNENSDTEDLTEAGMRYFPSSFRPPEPIKGRFNNIPGNSTTNPDEPGPYSGGKKLDREVNFTTSNPSSTQQPPSTRSSRRIPTTKMSDVQINSYDYSDVIMAHLLDEGYAETLESAEAIMANMSEEWRQDIMERENSPYETASDAALDQRYGYGRASGDKRSFGRAANRSSAAAALRALRRGDRSGSGTSTEAGADAVHRGWAKTAKTSPDQTPEKKAKRAKLANTEYKDLPDDEKEKDRVSFNAVRAIYKNRNK